MTRQTETIRQEEFIKNMYYSRYLVVRYLFPLYFFLHFYWFIFLWQTEHWLVSFFPLSLMLVGACSIWEQSQMRVVEQGKARVGFFFIHMCLLYHLILLASVLLGVWSFFYPFLTQSDKSTLFLAILLGSGLLIDCLLLWRLKKIDKKEDKQYQRIQDYVTKLPLN